MKQYVVSISYEDQYADRRPLVVGPFGTIDEARKYRESIPKSLDFAIPRAAIKELETPEYANWYLQAVDRENKEYYDSLNLK